MLACLCRLITKNAIGSASDREKRRWDPRINARTSGYFVESTESEDDDKNGDDDSENDNDNNENDNSNDQKKKRGKKKKKKHQPKKKNKKKKTKKKKRRSTNVNAFFWKDWCSVTEFGSNPYKKFVYTDNYGTHKNEDAQEILLEEKNAVTRSLMENASQHMQPVDQGPGKFFQDNVQS